MSGQSTNHIFMLEPVDFHENPQTRESNPFQHEDEKDTKSIQTAAKKEFRAFRDLLVSHGVKVTTGQGQKGCPDDIFCNNWVSTHAGRYAVFYPMEAENRQEERRDDLKNFIRKSYNDIYDFTAHEQHGKALESTGALCLDRINKIAYSNNSSRSDEGVAKLWAETMGYDLVRFETDLDGKPVYHADVVMWIGTEIAGISSACLKDADLVERLKKHRDVIEFTNEQMQNFCGNALEVIGTGGEKMLVMSKAGYKSLNKDQTAQLGKYYKTIIQPNLKTIEYYGGGSARCMMLEMF